MRPLASRRGDKVAQNRQDQTGNGEWQAKRVQENPGPLHKFREESKTGEDELGDAPVPSRPARGGEGRRARGFEDILSDAAETMQLVVREIKCCKCKFNRRRK